MSLAALATLGSLVALTTGATPDDPKVYALIVANNQAHAAPELAPLRFADDDGARYYELLSLTGERVTLLSVLDPETQGLHAEAAAAARVPSRRELDAALERIFAAMEEDRRQDVRTTFYFVYVGHGSIQPDGQGAMHLQDDRFTRADLFHDVLARSPATINHVVIDACHAYVMVQKRGGEEDVDRHVLAFLDDESLSRYPNTGVIVSTSQAAEVHEWARYSAGVFSHEVRSGMIGAADVDGDARVSYRELGAFVAAANAAVRDPRARIHAYAEPPAVHVDEPFFARRWARAAPTVSIPGRMAGRYWLEDARGVRYADLYGDGDLTLTMVPSSVYFLRDESSEIRIPLTGLSAADASRWPRQALAVAARGSEDLTFQRELFAVPFGTRYLQGYTASHVALPLPPLVAPSPGAGLAAREVAAYSLIGTAVGALALGVTYGVLAGERAEAHRTAIGSSAAVDELRAASENYATTANVMYVISGVLAAGAVGLWAWPSAP